MASIISVHTCGVILDPERAKEKFLSHFPSNEVHLSFDAFNEAFVIECPEAKTQKAVELLIRLIRDLARDDGCEDDLQQPDLFRTPFSQPSNPHFVREAHWYYRQTAREIQAQTLQGQQPENPALIDHEGSEVSHFSPLDISSSYSFGERNVSLLESQAPAVVLIRVQPCDHERYSRAEIFCDEGELGYKLRFATLDTGYCQALGTGPPREQYEVVMVRWMNDSGQYRLMPREIQTQAVVAKGSDLWSNKDFFFQKAISTPNDVTSQDMHAALSQTGSGHDGDAKLLPEEHSITAIHDSRSLSREDRDQKTYLRTKVRQVDPKKVLQHENVARNARYLSEDPTTVLTASAALVRSQNLATTPTFSTSFCRRIEARQSAQEQSVGSEVLRHVADDTTEPIKPEQGSLRLVTKLPRVFVTRAVVSTKVAFEAAMTLFKQHPRKHSGSAGLKFVLGKLLVQPSSVPPEFRCPRKAPAVPFKREDWTKMFSATKGAGSIICHLSRSLVIDQRIIPHMLGYQQPDARQVQSGDIRCGEGAFSFIFVDSLHQIEFNVLVLRNRKIMVERRRLADSSINLHFVKRDNDVQILMTEDSTHSSLFQQFVQTLTIEEISDQSGKTGAALKFCNKNSQLELQSVTWRVAVVSQAEDFEGKPTIAMTSVWPLAFHVAPDGLVTARSVLSQGTLSASQPWWEMIVTSPTLDAALQEIRADSLTISQSGRTNTSIFKLFESVTELTRILVMRTGQRWSIT